VRRWAFASLLTLSAAVAAGACGSSSNGGSGGGGNDSGQGGDTTSSSSSGSGSSSGSASSSGSSSGASSGSSSGTSSGTGSGSGSDASGGDATFAFDGYAHQDGWSEASYCPDDDGDGWTVCGGDCNDHDSLINPCAFDTNDPTDPVGHDGIDNDCDGHIDNLIMCEPTAAAGTFDANPTDYANSSDLCDNPMCPRLVNSKAIWYGPSPGNARRVTKHMGSQGEFAPRLGQMMSFLSNGTAVDSTDQSTYATCPGTDFQTTFVNPMPLTAAQNTNPCGTGVDESTVSVHDYTELRMTIQAPINAGSFAFDFAFFSEEFPVYVCAGFNDTFLAIQTSQQYPTGYQIAYDANNHRINVNNSFFQDCNSCANCVPGSNFTVTCPNSITRLNGTFFEVPLPASVSPPSQCNENHGSGGTDWLTTTSPINPGETFTLSWIIFDENDGILDSSIILDHFRWHSTTLGSPVTAR
jgi:hypothetical protein